MRNSIVHPAVITSRKGTAEKRADCSRRAWSLSYGRRTWRRRRAKDVGLDWRRGNRRANDPDGFRFIAQLQEWFREDLIPLKAGNLRLPLRARAFRVLFMPSRAGASWAFPGSGNLTQLRVTDETATIILIVQQRDFHRVVATFKPQFKSLVCHQ